jgi:hypothetical protein
MSTHAHCSSHLSDRSIFAWLLRRKLNLKATFESGTPLFGFKS